MKLFVLGRQPELSRAELESLGAQLEILLPQVVIDSSDVDITFDRLGGSIKQCVVIKQLPIDANPNDVLLACTEYLQQLKLPKLTFGISWYGYKKPPKQLEVTIKKTIGKPFGKIRFVLPKKNFALETAAISHNKLDKTKTELVIVRHQSGTTIAYTEHVQNIAAYTQRDYNKPCRDSRVGMLPPKLSQIIINLANPSPGDIVLDPFCGSGSLLMESQLMGFLTVGSDLDERMVDCAQKNTSWLSKNSPGATEAVVSKHNAFELKPPTSPYVIAAEGYLGKNFSFAPSAEQIMQQQKQLDDLYVKFFKHLHQLNNQPKRIVLCVPVWFISNQALHLKVIDQLEEFGYTKLKLQSADTQKLIYHREGQFVGRQILVLRHY